MCHRMIIKSLRYFGATMLCLTLLLGHVTRPETIAQHGPIAGIASDDHTH
jgi:hypothetical protein